MTRTSLDKVSFQLISWELWGKGMRGMEGEERFGERGKGEPCLSFSKRAGSTSK